MVHALVIIVLALRAFKQPALVEDKAFGWHKTAEITNAVAVGCVCSLFSRFPPCAHVPTSADSWLPHNTPLYANISNPNTLSAFLSHVTEKSGSC